MKRTILAFGACLFLAAALSWGQEPADPPSRVARLSFVEGSVSFRPASVEDWVAATMNYPLSTGDRLWTAESSYAEVHIGSTAIHLAPQTAFALSFLDDTVAQMSLSQGSLYVRIPTLAQGEVVEIDTPNCAVSLLQAGSYRLDVDVEHSTTFVRVRAGEAEVAGSGRTSRVRAGAMLRLAENQEPLETQDTAAPDAWEQSCAAQDQASEQYLRISESYVPTEMEGAGDLAQYGEWSTDPEFGAMWSPGGVSLDWAPYRNGHWAYIPPWGWTWIDDARWGFAPFHYGRWLVASGHWVWVPGSRDMRPVYSPALVVFMRGLRLSTPLPPQRGPLTGWVPLGPGEFYRPQRPVSERYLNRVNAPNLRGAPVNSAKPVAYRNLDRMIAVPQEALRGAKPVADAVVRVPRGEGAAAVPVNATDVQPLRQSYLGRQSNPGAAVQIPPAAAISRQVIAKHEIPRTAAPVEAPASALPRDSGRSPMPPANATPPPSDVVGRPNQQQRIQPPRVVPSPSVPQTVEQQRLEPQRIQQQRVEPSRSVPQTVEQPRAEPQRMEQQRAEQQRADQQRLEQQRADQQRADQQRSDQQRAAQQQAEQQRAAQQRAEQQRGEQQRADQQRGEQQQAEQQRAAQQQAEQQRAAQQRAEQQRGEQQRADQQRGEQQRADQQRAAQQAEQQRAAQQQAEQQRAAQQQAEQQRAAQQRSEQQQAEQQRAAQQRAEQQRADQQRAAQQQAEQQRAAQQQAEQQRAAQQQKADDAKKAEDAKKKQ